MARKPELPELDTLLADADGQELPAWVRSYLRTEPREWQISKSGDREVTVYVYDVVSPWGMSAKSLADRLEEFGELDTIRMRYNTPGGSVWEGWAMYSLLQQHPAKVIGYVDSVAASIGASMLMASELELKASVSVSPSWKCSVRLM